MYYGIVSIVSIILLSSRGYAAELGLIYIYIPCSRKRREERSFLLGLI